MANNENGNLVDSSGNVAVDFVWGNFPLQPNDDREENKQAWVTNPLLDATLDNHEIAYQGWSGYPLYTPNTAGAEGAGYIVVPGVIGQTTTNATDILEDKGLVVTVASGAANAAKSITRINVTTTTSAAVYTSSASTAYPVGTKVAIGAGTGIPAALVGTWTVTAAESTFITVSGTGFTVADTGAITPAASLTGVAATIKTQSIAAGANEIEVGDAITITPFAAAS
jgi:hypothetical protein